MNQQQTHINMASCVSPLGFAIMNYHKLGRSNNRNLVFTVLESESWRPGCQHGPAQVKALWLADSCFLALSQGGEKGTPANPSKNQDQPISLPLLLPAASVEAGGPTPPGALRCALGDRGRVRGRAAPYFVAELAAGASALSGPCRRGWLRGAVTSRRLQQPRWPPAGARASDDDAHRLLQQLVLSGNLIKEAVRRLQRAVAAVAATGPTGAPGPGASRSRPDPVSLQPSGALH
ncbi:GSK-3-binding protein FRAT2-like [Moschus berezovskii]|uniref:GSK-3-binding protein FRAT2-like n=1 Tax=Moschus berezovskii TaxID=68408 RepID=UPI0024449A34|nr:GSK-3-binding protein FRAT2-like [Moschus berezovskii]